jgi:hypothetical protein
MATARALATRSNAHGNPAPDRAQFPSVTDDTSGTGAVGAPMPFHPVRDLPGAGRGRELRRGASDSDGRGRGPHPAHQPATMPAPTVRWVEQAARKTSTSPDTSNLKHQYSYIIS